MRAATSCRSASQDATFRRYRLTDRGEIARVQQSFRNYCKGSAIEPWIIKVNCSIIRER
jgi:hypothetical protein